MPDGHEGAAPGMTTVGLIGSGRIGGTVARLAVDAGYDVVLSNSRGPETLEGLVDELGPHARAATPAQAAGAGDLVVVSIPLRAYLSLPVEPLGGKVVIETNNYYPVRDGQIAELDEKSATSSELLQRHLRHPRSSRDSTTCTSDTWGLSAARPVRRTAAPDRRRRCRRQGDRCRLLGRNRL